MSEEVELEQYEKDFLKRLKLHRMFRAFVTWYALISMLVLIMAMLLSLVVGIDSESYFNAVVTAANAIVVQTILFAIYEHIDAKRVLNKYHADFQMKIQKIIEGDEHKAKGRFE